MEYTMNDIMDSRENVKDDTESAQEDMTDDTMDHPGNATEYTMDHEATNETLSQLPDASESSEDDDEPSILEYARMAGIARDHQLDDTSVNDLLIMKENLDHDFFSYLKHDHLSPLDLQGGINLNERLSVSKGAARLLTSVAQDENRESIDSMLYPLLGSRDVKKLRVELPLLLTDNESDLWRFARRDGFNLKPHAIRFPLELVSIENNEGLEFPPEFYDLETEAFDAIMNEKIEVTRTSIIYFQAAMKVTLTKDEKDEVWESVRTQPRKFLLSNHVTPPLSPILLPPLEESSVFLPLACEVLLESEPGSLTSLDLENVEDAIFKQDLPTPIRDRYTSKKTLPASDDQFVKLADIESPPECIKHLDDYPSSPLENKRAVLADLKVEDLLTPPKPAEESPSKCVRFSNIVEGLLVSGRVESGIPELTIENQFFEEAFGESGKEANHRVERERLVDTRYHVKVPVMDFSIPEPPWMTTGLGGVNTAISILQKNIDEVGIGCLERCPGIKKLHPKLPWAPFTQDLSNVTEDSLGDGKSWESFLHGHDDDQVITSSDLTWKMEGLRILRQDEDTDDDDELELGYFSKNPDDTLSLNRKRKPEMEDIDIHHKKQCHDNSHRQIYTMQTNHSMIGPSMLHDISKQEENLQTSKRGRSDDHEQSSLLGGIFSPKDALSKFLEIRGVKKAKLIESAHFPAPNAQQPIRSNEELQPKEPLIEEASHPHLPIPAIAAPQTPIPIILSSTLLKNRPLIRSLQSLLPTLKICERDFSAHNTTIWNPGSVLRSPITSTLNYEADIIISPTTGLVITSLQHIKQKPLPGHKTAVPIRDRLEKVNGRYENLIILVSSPSSGLGDSDCVAWADFVGFTLTLQANIIVNYIPVDNTSPDDQTTARYISALIIQHLRPAPSISASSSSFELLDQESYWEIWLRRAGMNAYAAQATITQLKEPEPRLQPGSAGYEEEIKMIEGRGPYGLALFVEMGMEERVRRLGVVVGMGVLERVSRVVDRVWG